MASSPLRGAARLLQGSSFPSGKISSSEEKIGKSILSLPAGVQVGLGEGIWLSCAHWRYTQPLGCRAGAVVLITAGTSGAPTGTDFLCF